MTFEIFPKSTSNKNVPKGVFLLFERTEMNGELITTYYANDKGELFYVGDWSVDIPHRASIDEIADLTAKGWLELAKLWDDYSKDG